MNFSYYYKDKVHKNLLTLFNLKIYASYRNRSALKNKICLYVLNSHEQDFGAISDQRVKSSLLRFVQLLARPLSNPTFVSCSRN